MNIIQQPPLQKPQLQLYPEIGVPFEPEAKYVDLFERAVAACNTAKELNIDTKPTEEDKAMAITLVNAYAEDPENVSKTVTETRAASLRPASLVLTKSILDEFGQSVVKSAVHIRHLITNKLILESDHPDARVRLRALELLGKISDVGLFAEKTEIKVTHQSTDDLRNKLKRKLHRLVNSDEEADITDIIPEK